MSITINPASFTITDTTEHTYGNGTKTYIVETGIVELHLATGMVLATATRFNFGKGPGNINVKGFIGRYGTNPNAWRASVSFNEDGTLKYVDFGWDDKSGLCDKLNAISYDPALMMS